MRNLKSDTRVSRVLGVFQRPLTLILLQKHRDRSGSHIVIQIGGVYTTVWQKRAYCCKSITIEMGGVLRYFSKVLGSGVDLALLRVLKNFSGHRPRP